VLLCHGRIGWGTARVAVGMAFTHQVSRSGWQQGSTLFPNHKDDGGAAADDDNDDMGCLLYDPVAGVRGLQSRPRLNQMSEKGHGPPLQVAIISFCIGAVPIPGMVSGASGMSVR
jgi:hypothetical protein